MYYVLKYINKEGLSIYKFAVDTQGHNNLKGKIKQDYPDFVIDQSLLLAEVETRQQALYVRNRFAEIDKFLYKNRFKNKPVSTSVEALN